ncbi:MAG: iduronate-2-sulfatase, partial [Verrucomicrobiae bacterium]|nr:iduronate-2-sulfatase [Verrucomicrobiae bacterium]
MCIRDSDLTPLLKNPKAEWPWPAISTYGYQNHTVRTDEWRYIRYADGSEELYHNLMDPYEWTNLANRAEYARQKAELAKWLPQINKDPLPSRPDRAEEKAAKAQRKSKKQK